MSDPKIIVAVRKRPLSKKELQKNQTDIISVKNNETVIISELKQKVDLTKYIEETVFNFDYAFNENTTNEQIYDVAVRPLIDSAFQGAKVTCFAYGQTGSGKTFTMNGNQKLGVIGLYALGANDMFSYLADPRFQHLTAKLSYFQIYCGKLYDLLNKRQQLKIREDNKSNINIIGIQEIELYSWHEFLDYLKIGASQRITSQNSANSESSRSHGILQIALKDGKKTYGKISFIDLAGNERGADHTDEKKQTRIDGAEINKSLLSLKECIRALDQGKSHTPFRGSKLTMVLKDSFVGFCKTVMIGNISPSSASSENTLNTLRYADRVKQLKKSGNGSQTLTKEEIKAREMMLPRSNKNAIRIQISNDDDAQDIAAKREQAQKDFGIIHKKHDNMHESKGNQHSKNKNDLVHQPLRASSRLQKVQTKQIKQPQMATNVTKMNVHNEKRGSVVNTGNTINLDGRRNSFKANQLRGIPHLKQEMEIEEPKRTNRLDSQKDKNSHMRRQEPNNYMNMTRSQTITPSTNSTNNNRLGNSKNKGVMENFSLVNRPEENQFQQRPITTYNEKRQQLFQQQNRSNNFNNLLQCLQSQPEGLQNPQVYQNLQGFLLSQEAQLIKEHGKAIQNEGSLLRTQMNMVTDMQKGVNQTSTREYLTAMEESIDQKISLLEMLREKMLQFRYHYDAVQELQQKNRYGDMQIENDDNIMGDDEQLLDDLH